jgi:hypothetical protein
LALVAWAVVSGGNLPAASGSGMVKLTQYDRAEFCDLAVGPDSKLHAVFTDQPAYDKPKYLYYRASTDGGKTWSEAVNLSDDESGNGASYGRLIFDGQGRLYAVWKYVGASELLDGPGGNANGLLVYRAMEGGAWSKRVPLGDAKVPSYSWFVAADPKGAVHVVWSQVAKDALAAVGWSTSAYADLVREATLEGASVAGVKDVIAPKPILTKEQQAQIRAAGHSPNYEDTRPKNEGLINLRGYVDGQGAVHFVAESPGVQSGPSSQQTGRQIVLWDGAKLSPLYSFDKYKTFNIFNNPPALLVDAAGKQHLIRAPEKSEKPCVRDYPVEGTELGDFVNIIEPKAGPGALANWQAHQLPGGRMAVTAALSQKGGYNPEDTELYFSISDGNGKWSEPAPVSNSRAKKSSFSKDTVAGNAVAAVYEYRPRFASVAVGKDGKTCLLVVNSENTILGLTTAGVTSSGRVVSAMGTGRVENPAVFFLKF